MTGGAVIGVLSPFIGGGYYGGILAGIGRAAAAHGGRVIAVQTLDAGAYMAVNRGQPEFSRTVSWDRVDGFVVLPDAVDRRYLDRLCGMGKPVLLVGHEVAGLPCPAVLADNRTGIRDAVAHLIGHGRKRIAFVGYTDATDVQERYIAYQEALTAAGITPDPALFFRAVDNHESGAEAVAARLLGIDPRVTAVVAGTDRNAISVIGALQGAGRAVPADCAVTGFDDTDVAPFLTPGLASVRQMLDIMGGTAVEVLLRHLAGDDVAGLRYRVPTMFVPRGSCGCTDLGPPTHSGRLDTPRARLAAQLETLLAPVGARGPDEITAWQTAVDTVIASTTAAPQEHHVDDTAVTDALTALYRLRPQQDSLTIVGDAVTRYAAQVPTPDSAAAHRVASKVVRLVQSLTRIHGRATFADSQRLRAAVSAQYELSMDLLHTRDTDPRTLAWLSRTTASAGCLGLWQADGTHTDHLDVTPAWSRGKPPVIPGGSFHVAQFPPAELLDAASASEVTFVVPVKVNASDWGILAIVGAVETQVQDGREIMNQCAALLTVALDLRDQERRLRLAALRDALTGLPNRTAFLDALEDTLTRTRRIPEHRIAVLFLDLDGFKHINDTLGHAAGDQVLIHVADRIREHLRPTDLAARFGGDEFLVMVCDAPDDEVAQIADRLRTAITAPIELATGEVRVGVSIGTTLSGSTERHTADDLLLDADTAMYRMKQTRGK